MNLGGRRTISASSLIPIALVGVAIVVGGFLIGSLTDSVLPIRASSEAEQIDELFRYLLIIGGAIFLLVQGLLLYSVIRFRVPADDTQDGPNVHGNTLLEMIWTAIPAVIVLFLVVYSYQIWVSISTEKPNEMVVAVQGQRFAWSFTYTDPLNRLEGAETQTFSDSNLHTYVGRTLRLDMVTADVNHAFWVPTMRIKQDLLNGRETQMRFTPTQTGRYRIVCTELCGSGHGAMYSFIYVWENEEAFLTNFVDPAVDRILNPPEDPVERGRVELASGPYGCSGCHVLDDLNWVGDQGPSLNGIGERADERAVAAGVPSAAHYLAQSIRHPATYLVPGYGAIMPQFTPEGGANVMSDEALVNVVAYLCSITEGESACGDIEAIRAGDTAAIEEAVAAQR